jgi:hypothetical protein
MSALTTIGSVTRPDSWDLPLFVHILGAMLLTGALFLSAVSLIVAWRGNAASLIHLGFKSLFYGAIPGWILMRGGAEWIAHKEGLDNSDVNFAWLNIGETTADLGFVLLLASVVIGAIVVRRINRNQDGSGVSTRVATVLVSLLLVAYFVTVWAMTTKPV